MKKGDKAPDFLLYSDKTEPFQLSLQEKPVVLLFFPGAFTSVCTTELNTVSNELEAYGSAIVRGISTDSPFALKAFSDANGFRFDLLSDHDADVAAAYGCKYDRDFTSMKLDRISKRAAFVIDRDGTVAHVEVLENAGGMPDLDAVKEVVKAL
ncbi:MAG: anti-oxidant AhpCTSA family protein [Bacteroidetes bacterium CG12_big_fil_rev_8_21_14_0_65_60_17]|nr:MAG: anti-oxidant AhpCTSA family protein [Bacteroidetes bacterium CG12_big_fil_rev_8_21_14_0_65_60_17]